MDRSATSVDSGSAHLSDLHVLHTHVMSVATVQASIAAEGGGVGIQALDYQVSNRGPGVEVDKVVAQGESCVDEVALQHRRGTFAHSRHPTLPADGEQVDLSVAEVGARREVQYAGQGAARQGCRDGEGDCGGVVGDAIPQGSEVSDIEPSELPGSEPEDRGELGSRWASGNRRLRDASCVEHRVCRKDLGPDDGFGARNMYGVVGGKTLVDVQGVSGNP